MRFGVYVRKSYYTEHSESTKMQIDECLKHIDRVFPDEVDSITVYEDDGYIRSNMDRPGMNKLRANVADNLIDCVVIYRIDRVSSVMLDFCNFYTFLKDRDVKFITVKEGIDTNTPMGEAMMYLAVIFSSIEISNDTMRITDNMRHLASEGWWCGGMPPIGYKIAQVETGAKKSHKMLVPDPAELAYKDSIIRILLDNNFSLQQMETYCRHEGIRSLDGNVLSTTTIYSMLTAPYGVKDTVELYDYFADKGCIMDPGSPRELWNGSHGILVYGRTCQRMVDGKKRHEKAPMSEWRISIGRHEPVMEPAMYFDILGHFTTKKSFHAMRYETTLLKGVLRCKCGRLMKLARKAKVDGTVSTWYSCPRRERFGAEACDCSAIKADVLDAKVLEIFQGIEHDPETIFKYTKVEPPKSLPRYDTLHKQVSANNRKIERLTESLADSADSSAAKYIILQIEKLDREQTELRRQLDVVAADARRSHEERISLEEKRAEIVRLLSDFDSFTMAEKNEIACAVIQSATWDGETLFLTL